VTTHRERQASKARDAAWKRVEACSHRSTLTDSVVGKLCLECGGIFEPDAEAKGGGLWVPDWRKKKR